VDFRHTMPAELHKIAERHRKRAVELVIAGQQNRRPIGGVPEADTPPPIGRDNGMP
jgi:hypothetical protein